jgi:hypothetical protein
MARSGHGGYPFTMAMAIDEDKKEPANALA